MFSRIRNFGLVMLVVGTSSLSAFGQSTLPFSYYLPPEFSPGHDFFEDPNAPVAAAVPKQSSSGATTLTTRVQPNYFSSKDFQLKYSLIVMGLSQQSQYEKFHILSFRIYTDMKYRISEDFMLFASPYIIMRSGADQSSGASRNSTIFFPKDASLIWTPFAWWQLRGGILDQNFYHSMLFMEDQAFPALRTSFFGGSERAGAALVGEQAILQYSSNTNTTNQIEETPTLSTGAVEGHYQFNHRSAIKASVGYFQFENLPSAVAADGMLNGNTVRRESETFSVFAYKFHGVEVRTRLELGFGPMDFNLYAEGLRNEGAPDGMNTAWNAGTEIRYRGARNRKYGLDFEYFRVEPDAAVSAYNAIEFDRSNRNGMMAMPYFKWGGKRQSKVGLRYVTSNLIYENAPQSEVTSVRLRWETDYDFL
jgi:hypothetical protein